MTSGYHAKTYVFQRVGDKPYEDSRAYLISKIFKRPVVWVMLNYLLILLAHLTTKKEAQHLVGQFEILMQYILHLEYSTNSFIG